MNKRQPFSDFEYWNSVKAKLITSKGKNVFKQVKLLQLFVGVLEFAPNCKHVSELKQGRGKSLGYALRNSSFTMTSAVKLIEKKNRRN